MVKKEQKNKCAFCGGSWTLSFFKGVSRFLLSTEECSECAVAATSWILVPEKQ